MLVLRSILFNVAFYASLAVQLVLGVAVLPMRRRTVVRYVQAWGHISLWLLRVLAGTRVEFRGLERLPPGGLLLASKHQSLWETFALLTIVDDPVIVMKRELTYIPFFGWLARQSAMISVDRKAGSMALAAMNRRAKVEVGRGRQLIIFPEGTRRPAGAEPAYKYGIVHLYSSLGVPCVPVALNSGLYWPRRRFLRRPGTIVAEVLEPIAPGLSREAFMTELKSRLEAASTRLLEEGRAELGLVAGPEASPSPA